MNFDLTINKWTGAQRLTPKPRQFQLLRIMLYDLITELVVHGLPANGNYWAKLDAESTIGASEHEYRIQKRAGNDKHPGVVYLRVWFEKGTGYAVSLTLAGNNKFASLCDTAVRNAIGSHNHFQFTQGGRLVRGGVSGAEAKAQRVVETARPAAATPDEHERTSEQPELQVEPPTPAAQAQGEGAGKTSNGESESKDADSAVEEGAGKTSNGESESKDADSAVGLSRFFADGSSRVLVLAQLAELCAKAGKAEVPFPVWLRSIQEQWGSTYLITSVGVRRAIAREGRKIGWFLRKVEFGTTWYSITPAGVKVLSAENSYRDLADRYQQIAGYASNDPVAPAANDPVAQLANKHAEFIASERELLELRAELVESGEILRNLRETVSRLTEELRTAKVMLREAEADTITEDDVAEAERKLAELRPSEDLYQRVAALLPR